MAWGVRKAEGATTEDEAEEADEDEDEELDWKEPRGPAELKPWPYEAVPFVERGVVGCGVERGVPFFLFSNISRPTLSRASLSMCEVIAAAKVDGKRKRKKKVDVLSSFLSVCLLSVVWVFIDRRWLLRRRLLS